MTDTISTHMKHDFDFLHGKWRVRHATRDGRLAGATTWSHADAIDIVTPAFQGLGNTGRFMRLIDGQPYEGMPIRLYDPSIDMWRIWWVDTEDHRMDPPVTGGFQKNEGLFEGEDVLRGKPIRVRFTWSNITKNEARWDQAYSPDNGATWELNSIMEFSRDNSLPDHPTFPLP